MYRRKCFWDVPCAANSFLRREKVEKTTWKKTGSIFELQVFFYQKIYPQEAGSPGVLPGASGS